MEDAIVSLQLSNDLWRQEVIQLNSQIRLTETYLENAKDRIRVLEEIIRHFESDIKKREEQSQQTPTKPRSSSSAAEAVGFLYQKPMSR